MGFRGFRGHGLSVKGLGLGVVGLGLTLIQGSGLPGFLTIINKSGDQGLGFWADVYIPIASKTPLGHSGLALSLFRYFQEICHVFHRLQCDASGH